MLADLQLAVLEMTAKEQISNCMVITNKGTGLHI